MTLLVTCFKTSVNIFLWSFGPIASFKSSPMQHDVPLVNDGPIESQIDNRAHFHSESGFSFLAISSLTTKLACEILSLLEGGLVKAACWAPKLSRRARNFIRAHVLGTSILASCFCGDGWAWLLSSLRGPCKLGTLVCVQQQKIITLIWARQAYSRRGPPWRMLVLSFFFLSQNNKIPVAQIFLYFWAALFYLWITFWAGSGCLAGCIRPRGHVSCSTAPFLHVLWQIVWEYFEALVPQRIDAFFICT